MGNNSSIPRDSSTTAITGDETTNMPDASASSNSCSSESLSDEDEKIDDDENLCPMNPYEDDYEMPLNSSKGQGTTEESSECYRFPIFNRKPSALATFNAKESERDDSTCFPRSLSQSSLTHKRSSSFVLTSCAVAVSETLTLGDGDQEATSSILGCVNSPLLPKSNSWTNLIGLEDSLQYTSEEIQMVDGDLPTPESDLQGLREYWIVTTAALPWMTGTAVNPLLRAAYLSQRNRSLQECSTSLKSTVTLVVPWLEEAEDRLALYGKDWENATPQIQENFIRNWLRNSAELYDEANVETGGITIQWYPARYHAALSSIFAMGDLCELIPPSSSNMICILEEPEHVNFYRAPGRESWRDKFPHVIGIAHTNYKAYAQNHYSGLLTGPLVGALSSLMVRAYCDKVVKLSPVLQSYAPYKEVVSNVHGIRQEFFSIPQNPQASGIYFIGKLLWAKGLDKLLELEACYRKATGSYFPIDIIGSGPHEAEIQKSFLGHEYFPPSFILSPTNNKNQPLSPSSSSINDDSTTNSAKRYWRRFRQPIPARFLGRQDHAQAGATGEYKIFINPSITEVLCTTTAEAVAMGIWVIIPNHASNEFFLPFGNCLQYNSRREFVELLQYCQTHDPPGWCLSQPDRTTLYEALSWKAATERLIETAFLSKRDACRCQRLQPNDRNIQEWHYALGRGTRGDVLRKVLGGGPVADQSQYVAPSRDLSERSSTTLSSEPVGTSNSSRRLITVS